MLETDSYSQTDARNHLAKQSFKYFFGKEVDGVFQFQRVPLCWALDYMQSKHEILTKNLKKMKTSETQISPSYII